MARSAGRLSLPLSCLLLPADCLLLSRKFLNLFPFTCVLTPENLPMTKSAKALS